MPAIHINKWHWWLWQLLLLAFNCLCFGISNTSMFVYFSFACKPVRRKGTWCHRISCTLCRGCLWRRRRWLWCATTRRTKLCRDVKVEDLSNSFSKTIFSSFNATLQMATLTSLYKFTKYLTFSHFFTRKTHHKPKHLFTFQHFLLTCPLDNWPNMASQTS